MRTINELTDDTHVDTNRHTFEQADTAWKAGVGILVGGPEELGYGDLVDDDGGSADPDVPAERLLEPDDIASIERVPVKASGGKR